MRKRYQYFIKIDLAGAYNQILLSPDSQKNKKQKQLALSTNLLQERLPFGIISVPGYFQKIMDKLTQDLPGVSVYIDDILMRRPLVKRSETFSATERERSKMSS